MVLFILTLSVQIGLAQNADLQLMQILNVNRNTQLDQPMIFLSESASAVSLCVPTSTFLLGAVSHKRSEKLKAIYMAESMAINTVFTLALKYSIDRQRPFKADESIVKLSVGGSPSFPSGHTSNAFALATSFTVAYPKWYVALPSYSWAEIVGYSRMHTGVHYPSDVLFGALLGTSSAYLSQFLNQQLFKTYQKPKAY